MSLPDDCEPAESLSVGSRSPSARTIGAWIGHPFAKQGAWALLDQAVVSGTSFLTSVIIGRLCSREDLGLYFLALTVVLIARGLQDQLISAPYVVYGNRRRGRSLASYTASTLVHQAAFSGIAMAALAGLALVLQFVLGPSDIAPLIWVLVPTIPWILLREYTRQLAFAHLQVSTAIVLDVTVCLFQLGGLVVLALTGWLSVSTAYLVIAGACALSAATWFFSRRRMPLEMLPSRILPDWRQNWSLARWALAGMAIGPFTPHVTTWMLTHWHDTHATGLLAAAATLVGPGQAFLTGMSNYLWPQSAAAFANGGSDELRRMLARGTLLVGVPIGVFAALFAVLGGPLLVLVYGPEYSGGGLVVAALAGSVLINALGSLSGSGLWAMERPQANFLADLAALAATLLVALFLIRPLGPLGAALSTLVGSAAGCALRCLTIVYMLNTPRPAPVAENPSHATI